MSALDQLNVAAHKIVVREAKDFVRGIPPELRDKWHRMLTIPFEFNGFLEEEKSGQYIGRIYVCFGNGVEEPKAYAANVPLHPIPGWHRNVKDGEQLYPVLHAILRSSYDWLVAYVLTEWYAGKIVEVDRSE